MSKRVKAPRHTREESKLACPRRIYPDSQDLPIKTVERRTQDQRRWVDDCKTGTRSIEGNSDFERRIVGLGWECKVGDVWKCCRREECRRGKDRRQQCS